MADLATRLMEVTHVIHQMDIVLLTILLSELILNVTEFSVGEDTPLSDHNYIRTTMQTVECADIDTCSEVVTKHTTDEATTTKCCIQIQSTVQRYKQAFWRQ